MDSKVVAQEIKELLIQLESSNRNPIKMKDLDVSTICEIIEKHKKNSIIIQRK